MDPCCGGSEQDRELMDFAICFGPVELTGTKFTHSLTPSLAHSLTPSLTHPLTHSPTHSIPSESAELLRSATDIGKKINIQSSYGVEQTCTKTCSWDNHCAPWWMKNVFQKIPELIVPSLRWTTWALTRLHMEESVIKIARLPSWTQNWPMIHFTCDLCHKKRNLPLRILSRHDFVG